MVSPAWAVTRYVDLNSGSPTPPYTNWAMAAITIQDAVSISIPGDIVLVTNGVYDTGGAVRPAFPDQTNRVMITNNITVTSVNGPIVTSIVGQFDPNTGGTGSNAVRCVYVSGGGRISGFTLTNGATVTSPFNLNVITGGGLFLDGGTASNLIIRNCRAFYGGGGVLFNTGANLLSHSLIMQNIGGTFGGGVMFNGGATMRNCVIAGNSGNTGGGVYMGLSGSIEACTIAGNSANGGAHGLHVAGGSSATVVGSIVYGNTTNNLLQYNIPTNLFSYSCTTPLPIGPGNIDVDPLFIDTVNYRIDARSPCVDAGTNMTWMLSVGALDIDGEPRLRNGQADIGADEAWQFQALSVNQQFGAFDIVWDTSAAGTFELYGSTNLPAHVWMFTGVTVTSVVPYATTTLINASVPYEAYRLQRTGP